MLKSDFTAGIATKQDFTVTVEIETRPVAIMFAEKKKVWRTRASRGFGGEPGHERRREGLQKWLGVKDITHGFLLFILVFLYSF
jgi:hypothetical protein